MKRKYLYALILPWLIMGAVGMASAGIVGAAAWNLASEARIEQERTREASAEVMETEDGVPPLYIIPDLVVIEGYEGEPDEYYPDAP